VSIISPLPDLTTQPHSAASRAPDFSGLVGVPLYRLSVEQYHAMIRAGILGEDDAVELLEGWLVLKMGRNPPHRMVTNELRDLLTRLLPSGWFVDSQEALPTEDSSPEPDVTVIRGRRRNYEAEHPGPADTPLVVEVADTSLAVDRGVKLRLYARAVVPVYWIVNLVDRQVEVYSDPTGPVDEPTYRNRQDFGPEATLPIVLDGQEVGRLRVGDLLS
jgi:Uma2 family endonuclease